MVLASRREFNSEDVRFLEEWIMTGVCAVAGFRRIYRITSKPFWSGIIR
jgi:hypothetical protein